MWVHFFLLSPGGPQYRYAEVYSTTARTQAEPLARSGPPGLRPDTPCHPLPRLRRAALRRRSPPSLMGVQRLRRCRPPPCAVLPDPSTAPPLPSPLPSGSVPPSRLRRPCPTAPPSSVVLLPPCRRPSSNIAFSLNRSPSLVVSPEITAISCVQLFANLMLYE